MLAAAGEARRYPNFATNGTATLEVYDPEADMFERGPEEMTQAEASGVCEP
jgi:hypothetical protein